MSTPVIDELIKHLSRLPGLGPRSARRAALHLLKLKDRALYPLAESLSRAAAEVKTCHLCGNLDGTDPCSICDDPKRQNGELCVIADVADLWALERAQVFRGTYHVLGGVLSALEGVRPEDLRLESLRERLADGAYKEVILALAPSVDGQITLHYIQEHLEPLGIAVTRLATGLPVGGELEYLDDGTLTLALSARR